MSKREYLSSDNMEGSERKKVKILNDKPSKVLHIRNVVGEIVEKDIANLAVPFGLVSYLVLTRKTGQALMEMVHEESATAMVEYYSKHPPQFGGKNLIIQFSRYESLSGSGMHPEAEVAVRDANEEVKHLCENEPRLVLHVSVENWTGPRLGHLHFYKLFHRFGSVSRIIVFTQNQNPQALVELESEVAAHVAKLQLAGTTCFYGHVIRVDFSNRKTLDVKHESDTGRDYTISPVSRDELSSIPSFSMNINSNIGNNYSISHEYSSRQNSYSNNSVSTAEALAMLQPILQQASANPETIPLLQNIAPHLASFLNSNQGSSSSHSVSDERPSRKSQQHSSNNSPVLIVDNLEEERVSPDALFILFGSYGDVLRIKILYNKKSTALIQFVDSEQAARAQINLNNVRLYGKAMRVNFSRHNNISMPKPDEQNSVHLNKDYSMSKLHRFKKATSRTLQNIYPPGSVLHIAGLPESYDEREIKNLFDREGFCIVKVKMINPNDRKMALIQLENVADAIEALIKMHDYDTGSTHLRVSFSKGSIAA